MGNLSDITLQIRKIIFEKFNDTNLRFTGDEIFEVLKTLDIDKSLTIDDMKPFFNQLHKDGLLRPIAQDFTTQWFKLFAEVEKIKCNKCNLEIHLGKLEDRICPNPSCKAAI
ncbi:MAG TPA: hypothetical protein VJZ17_04250 [Nitrosopumilaceae archaeon]|nr:hypothetical protein [Nitrosopumilaceae archaeon]